MVTLLDVLGVKREAARFWANVDKSGECWLWQGAPSSRGYGQISIRNRLVFAHRFSYLLAHGEIPGDLLVCHNCPTGDNRLCVNPAHLFLGTHQDNSDDKHAKGRANPAHGIQRPQAKLTPALVREIRQRHAAGEGYRRLGQAYGVQQTTILAVVRRRTWKQVAD